MAALNATLQERLDAARANLARLEGEYRALPTRVNKIEGGYGTVARLMGTIRQERSLIRSLSDLGRVTGAAQ